MSTTKIKESPNKNQLISASINLHSKMQLLESQLRNLQEFITHVPFLIVKHQFDQLISINNDFLYTQHDLLTYLQLIKMGLYDSLEIDHRLNQHRLSEEIDSLEVRIKNFRRNLFRKTSSTLPL